MAPPYQVGEVLERRRLVLNQYENQVQCQRGQGFLVPVLVDCREIRYTIALAIVGDDGVHKGHKQVLGVFRSSAREIGTERVQDQEVLVWTVVQRL